MPSVKKTQAISARSVNAGYLLRYAALMNVVKNGDLVVVKPILAVFRKLNERALSNLRERKFMGIKYSGDPKKYLNYLNDLNKESKKKKRSLAMEMMAEGYVRIHQLERRKIFT